MAKKENENAAAENNPVVEGDTMAKYEKKSEPIDPDKELVTIQLFKDGGRYKDDVDVAVNGRLFRIKRGEKVQVPAYVAEVLERSMKQDAETAAMIERKSTEYELDARKYNI